MTTARTPASAAPAAMIQTSASMKVGGPDETTGMLHCERGANREPAEPGGEHAGADGGYVLTRAATASA